MPTAATIAHDAFIYGYPTVDLYNILYKYAADPSSPEYKAPLNTIYNTRHVATPQDTAIVAPNCDTPYSYAWLDLRAEPMVLSIPPFEPNRYVSLMLVDLYTYIVGYVTPRTNGSRGGDFLVAGPDWQGSTPPGIKRVLHAPTQFALAFYRTQLFGPEDLPAVWKIQDQFGVQPLSQYAGTPAPAACAGAQMVRTGRRAQGAHIAALLCGAQLDVPVYATAWRTSRSCAQPLLLLESSPHKILPNLTPETGTALVEGMQAGQQEMAAHLRTVKSSGELFGSREFLGHNYLSRAVGAMVGILGNSAEEYLGIGYQGDAEGQPFDGSHCYRIKFTPDAMPPVKAFWSITVYDAHMLLYANSLQRYVVNSAMVDQLVRDADGGFTLYVQHDSPGPDKEANWLPVPAGRFNLTFRAYQPEQAILDFTYHAPPVVMAA